MTPFLEPQHQQLQQRLTDFVQRDLPPYCGLSSDEAARAAAPQAVRLLGQSGWLSGLDCRGMCLFREQVAGWSPLVDCLFAIQGLAQFPLIWEAQSPQQQRWLERAQQGLAVGAFAMTEPQAGSDVASLQTRAHLGPEGWRLQGQKWLISNAGVADFYVVFASIEPDQGSRGIGAFLVEGHQPGLKLLKAQVLSNPHPLGHLELLDCPAELLSRQGFKLGMRTLDTMRISVAAAACGMAGRALQQALEHASGRSQFGQPLAKFQMVQQKLAQMATSLEAARLLTYRAAWQRDQGLLPNTQEVAMAKAFATEQAQLIIDQSLQILGGQGLLAEHPVEQLYRSVRALRIYEGTTEIQYLIIAKELLKTHVDSQPARST